MRSLLAAVVAASLLAVASLVGVTPAHAAVCTAPSLVGSSVSPRRVTVGVVNPTGFEVTARYRTNGCTIAAVEMDVFAQTEYLDTVELHELGTVGGVTTYSAGLRLSAGSMLSRWAGAWRTTLYATWDGRNTNDDGPTLRVRRAARLSANARPEPVRDGDRIVVRGTLKRANWQAGRYAGYSERTVRLQFAPAGGTYRTVRVVTSGRGGAVRAAVTATRDGCFRFVYRGNATTAPKISKRDCVNVV